MKTLLTSVAALAVLTGTALAQDASYRYTTPVLRAGQPVVPATVEPIAVPVPVPAAQVNATGYVDPAPTPATAEDDLYLGDLAPQTSSSDSSVTFVSGGIGMHGKAQIEAVQNQYRLKSMFSNTTGHFLAGVNVTVADSKGGTVLSTVTEGPFLLANLKPGTYTVVATYEGITQSKKVTIGSSGLKKLDFYFNAEA